jgi:EmrB/QacA subfamily drug resistance transporter
VGAANGRLREAAARSIRKRERSIQGHMAAESEGAKSAALEAGAEPEDQPGVTVGAAQQAAKPRRKLPAMVPSIIAAAFFMEGLDTAIVNTSLPSMARDFMVTAPEMSAAITAYLLALAIFIPVSGWIADRYGARQVFIAAIALFSLGSVLCGLSDSVTLLVMSRVVQGIGGAMMTPIGRLILAQSFPKHELMRAMTFYMMPANLGPTVGPVLGGFITANFGWQWNFFLNLPLGILGIALALRYIENVPMPRAGRFDWWGYVILALGIAAAQLTLETLAHPDRAFGTFWLLLLAAVCFLGGYAIYARRVPDPVLDFRLFRTRVFAVAVGFGNILRMSTFPVSFLVALLLQLGFGLDPFQAGLLLCFFTMGAMTMRANVANIAAAIGMRRLLIICSLTTACVTAGFIFFTEGTPFFVWAAYLFGFGVLRNAQHQTVTALSFADIPDKDFSKSTTISALLQRGGQSMGVGISATLLALSAGGEPIGRETFVPVFLVLAAISATTAFGFARLKPEDGWQVSGHRPKGH